jgi:hypothetical protein
MATRDRKTKRRVREKEFQAIVTVVTMFLKEESNIMILRSHVTQRSGVPGEQIQVIVCLDTRLQSLKETKVEQLPTQAGCIENPNCLA